MAVAQLVGEEGWDKPSRDALHGLYGIASEVSGGNALDIVSFSPETATAGGMTLPSRIVFGDSEGNQIAVEWPSSKVTPIAATVDQ